MAIHYLAPIIQTVTSLPNYRAAAGGGARIVDKYSKKNKPTEELQIKEGQRVSAA